MSTSTDETRAARSPPIAAADKLHLTRWWTTEDEPLRLAPPRVTNSPAALVSTRVVELHTDLVTAPGNGPWP